MNKRQIHYLKSIGYLDEDIPQIEQAMQITTYTKGRKVLSKTEVNKLLSEEDYLATIGRSAFHWTSMSNKHDVLFDSSKLFESEVQ